MAHVNSANSYNLKLGDSDKQKRWEGATNSASSGEHVRNLQLNLAAVGCLTGKADGEFGPGTLVALKRFQWHLHKVRRRLNASGQAVVHEGIFPPPSGVFDATTRRALAEFVTGQFTCAGPLVRVAFNRFVRFRANTGFEQLVSGASCMVVDRDFVGTLAAMNAKAAQEGLYVYVNQTFRLQNAAVTGAVVKPANYSAHRLGRAIDLQLGSAAAAQPSTSMVSAPHNTPIGRFRDHMVALGCRYGGAFKDTDAPHYDRQIFPFGGEEWNFRFYFAQRQLTQDTGSRATRVPVV
jgi:Putative peptidoglycan binding domain